MEQPRWKSWVLWSSIIAQVLGILVLTGVIDTGLAEQIERIGGLALQMFAALGIINNPTDKANW